ncbi:MAG: iron-sulfur cluster-binding protein [Phycisphaeraceae bacterium]|nr:iron-sulfur cluster-binding protein [Phycisphaeraceae bacterium]
MNLHPDTHAAPATLTHEGEAILFPPLPYDIGARADAATANPALQKIVSSAARLKDTGRKTICPDVFGDNYNAMRAHAGAIKQHTLDHADHYLEQFVDHATAAGATVHFAADAEQANAICLDIARDEGGRLCVKSKSMVTEETHLVPALERIGVETVESDLGEFIIQIDGDAPSHIVQPMIHKDRTSVGRAFERVLNVPYTEEPEALAAIARDHLRDKYRHADLGITGANFLVADTGSVVICTNEGNGRFCSSAPRVHVVVAGFEKLLPRCEHLALFLKLLARSATQQPLTCYTHVMTGPRRGAEPDGPEQMHIILVDNGRSEILRAPSRELLRCIRCGACLNACPVYRTIGGHAYGGVYSGPIGALVTPLLRGLENYRDLPHASSLCGACYEACPVKIDIPRHLIRLRAEQNRQRISKASDRLMYRLWGASLRYPVTYRIAGFMQKLMMRWGARRHGTLEQGDRYRDRGWIEHAPGPLSGWTSQRDLPTPTASDFRHWWRHRDGDRP